jgi:hypothetical protein
MSNKTWAPENPQVLGNKDRATDLSIKASLRKENASESLG